jgi:hypothetical protein
MIIIAAILNKNSSETIDYFGEDSTVLVDDVPVENIPVDSYQYQYEASFECGDVTKTTP